MALPIQSQLASPIAGEDVWLEVARVWAYAAIEPAAEVWEPAGAGAGDQLVVDPVVEACGPLCPLPRPSWGLKGAP